MNNNYDWLQHDSPYDSIYIIHIYWREYWYKMPQVQPYSKVDSHGTLYIGWETMLSYTRTFYGWFYMFVLFFSCKIKWLCKRFVAIFLTTTKNEWRKQLSIRNNLYMSSRISGAVDIYNLSEQGF